MAMREEHRSNISDWDLWGDPHGQCRRRLPGLPGRHRGRHRHHRGDDHSAFLVRDRPRPDRDHAGQDPDRGWHRMGPGSGGGGEGAGADFVVTPVVLPEVAEACRKEDILCVLGALTPTEIYHARLAGANLVKVFPVGPVGGPDYIKALQGPMGGVPLWASGGVEIDQIPAYLRLGVKAVGLTGALFPAEALAHRDMAAIVERATRAAQAAAAARAD